MAAGGGAEADGVEASTRARWAPVQYKQPEGVDLRGMVASRVGPKRRRDDEDEDDGAEAAAADMQVDEAAAQAGTGPSSKRQKADDVTWRPVSGKVWKAPGQRAGTVMKPAIKKGSWEKRMAEKAQRQQLQGLKNEAVAEARAKRKANALQRKAAKERKLANRAKSEVVQNVSTATAKKMMKNKKHKKLLRSGDAK